MSSTVHRVSGGLTLILLLIALVVGVWNEAKDSSIIPALPTETATQTKETTQEKTWETKASPTLVLPIHTPTPLPHP